MANQEQQNQRQEPKQPIKNPQHGGAEKNFANQPGKEKQGGQNTQAQPGKQDRPQQQSESDRKRQ